MAINFKPIERGEPGVTGGGTKKFYAKIVYGPELNMDEMVKDIEKFSALSEPDIRGVLIAFENKFQDGMAAGRIIRMEKLGTFYPSISSKGEEKAEDVSSASIRDAGVNYHPGDRIIKAMKDGGFKKVSE